MSAKKTQTKTASASTKTASATGSKVSTRERHDIVYKEIKTADRDISQGYITLAHLLYEAYHNDMHEQWGYKKGRKGFTEFVSDELDIHYRKAMYLVDIADKVKELDLDDTDVQKMGWTKMKELSRIIDKKNHKQWMEKAKDMTTDEVIEAVKMYAGKKKATGESGGPENLPVVMKLTMNSDEGSIMTEAINTAKKVLDTENDVNALVYIAQEWMQTSGTDMEAVTLENQVAFLEKTYGVKLDVTPVNDKDAESSAETLKAEAEEAVAKKKTEAAKETEKAGSKKKLPVKKGNAAKKTVPPRTKAKGKVKPTDKAPSKKSGSIDDLLGLNS